MKKASLILLVLISAFSFNFTEDKIKIEPINFNFGRVSQGKIVITTVTIKNQINEEININIRTTCGCMVAGEKKFTLSPDDSKKIEVKLDTTGYDGFITKEILVTSDNTGDEPLGFLMQGTVKKSILQKIFLRQKMKNVIYTDNFQEEMINNPQIISFFAYKNCNECIKILGELNKWSESKNQNINIHYYGLEDEKNKKNLYELSKKISYYPELPLVIYQNNYYSGKKSIENLISEKVNVIEKNDKKLISKLNPSAIFIAGMLDGINPCAFTVIILLLSYLSLRFKNRVQILLSGLFYIISVFITYFLVGFGLFEVIRKAESFKIISVILKYGLTAFLFILSTVSFYDYLKAEKNKRDEMLLKLPEYLSNSIRKNIREQMKDYRILIGSLMLGFTVSLFELVCTGQIYFPVIGYMVRTGSEKSSGMMLLLLYNFAFIIPLGAVFIMAYFGISSKAMGSFFNKHLSLVKLLFAVLFAAFGIINFII